MSGWDPFGAGYAADPFPALARLRRSEPVFWSPRLRRFVLTRYADVAAVLQDPATYSSAVIPQVPPADRDLLAEFTRWSARWLFFLDPPEHAARRGPVARALAPRALAHLAGPVGELARRLVGDLPRPEFDVLADLAHPLAARVIAGLLRPPGAATEEFLAQARVLERADACARDPQARRAGLEAMAAAAETTRRYQRCDAPMMSALRAAWGDDEDLVGAHSLMLVFAGVETTQNLIVNTVHAVLRHAATGDPGALVEEGARFAPPVLGVLRRATRDVLIAGRAVPAGAELVVMTAAANRDPARFPDPDRFDPGRRPNPHLSFGLGRHYCPGAELSRLTARAALTALLEAFPRLALSGPRPRWRDHDPIVHAPAGLTVGAV
ncbi:cytochrome P450 [Dactylosporangium sp. CA-139066]|uniref:cytochrome P450 n=1 Tax=Dactylosporangium sp. CA-139066 TaxID=3239930 RepID=UPI003D8E0868